MKKWSLSFCLLASLLLSCTVPCHAGDSSSFTPVNVSAVAPSGGAVPVGTVITWPFASHPDGWSEGKWLECNGQTITSSAYPELYALGYSSVPDFRNRTLWGDTSPRTVKAASLPNITGTFQLKDNKHLIGCIRSTSGSFSSSGTASYRIYGTSSSSGGPSQMNFSASSSSSIYKDGVTTVQPPALTTRFLIRSKP